MRTANSWNQCYSPVMALMALSKEDSSLAAKRMVSTYGDSSPGWRLQWKKRTSAA